MDEPKFSISLAAIIFGENTPDCRVGIEEIAVERFKTWINKTAVTKAVLLSNALVINNELIARLSGPNRLAVARMIEDRYPEVIDHMPELKRSFEQLKRAFTLEQVFMPSSMSMLVRALEEEGER